MPRTTQARLLDQPIDDVFAYVADFSNTADWDPGVSSARRTGEGPIGEGATFEVQAVFMGQKVPMSYRIVAYEPPTRLVLEGTSSSSEARDELWFAPAPDGKTRITWILDLKLQGAAALAEKVFAPMVHRLGQVALDGLQERMKRPV